MNTFDDLYSAVECSDLDSAKEILTEQPSLINEKGEWDFAIMHGAVMSDNDELVEYLIAQGADINAKNDEGITPLHIVLYPEIAQILIDKGANVNALSNSGETPLHVMASDGEQTLDVVELLLENGADKTIKNKSGETAFDISKMREEEEMMEALKC